MNMQFKLVIQKSNGQVFSKSADMKEKGLRVENKNLFGAKMYILKVLFIY